MTHWKDRLRLLLVLLGLAFTLGTPPPTWSQVLGPADFGPCGRGLKEIAIYYVNGVTTDIVLARANMLTLQRFYLDGTAPALPPAFNNVCVKFKLLYNPANGFISDALETFAQIHQLAPKSVWQILGDYIDSIYLGGDSGPILGDLASALTNPSYINSSAIQVHASLIQSDIRDNCRSMLLVPHSQGNLYAHMAYDQVFGVTNAAIPPEALRVVGIASADIDQPSAFRAHLRWQTSATDILMGTSGVVRKLYPNIMPVTTNWSALPLLTWASSYSGGHSFTGYLTFSPSKDNIQTDIVTALTELPLTSCGFTFSAPTYSGTAPGIALITITRKGGSATVESVTVSTSDGTAHAGIDYVPLSQQVTFQPGDSSKTVTITLLNNASSASGITVNLSLDTQSTAVLTITKAGSNLGTGTGVTSGIITTVAGGGGNVFSGDGGLATNAGLYPSGIAVDVGGNLYIADGGHGRVRKVSAQTGIITTIAGTGGSLSSGDGGLATSAGLVIPSAVALDVAGNLYIADGGGKRVRKVNAQTGIITTVAGGGSAFPGDGGLATSADLSPTGIALDVGGNLYIADSGNARVRKVNVQTGIITTVAGGGPIANGDGGLATSARLSTPADVALDAAGNLYIADYGQNRVRMVNVQTGIITTVAGVGGFGFFGDGGPATSAVLNAPSGIVVDAAGNIYISDSNNNRVRRVDVQSGIITTVAGNGSVGFGGDNGPATSAELVAIARLTLDSAGNLYIANANVNGRVRKVSW